jgi:opacity protein-like surface antigen
VIRTRLFAGLLAAAIAVPAQAQLIGIGVGALVPQGDLADGQKSGLAVSGNIEFGGRLKFRAELLWANSDLKGVIITDPDEVPVPDDANVSGDVKYIGGLGSGVFYFGTGVFQPYVLGGLGFYSRSVAQDVEDAAGDIDRLSFDDSDLGWHFGAGLKLKFNSVAVFGELRYHRINNEGDVKTNFLPIMIGVRLF